jgi:very-short-patch-repair endonuclease
MDTYRVDFILQDGQLIREVTYDGCYWREPATYSQERAYFLGLTRGNHLTPEQVAEEINREVLGE